VPNTESLNLDAIGVQLDQTGRIVVDAKECTNTEHIYAIGDCSSHGIDLTPVAIAAGRRLEPRTRLDLKQLLWIVHF
jgi:glutathione reductase (NADPH)